MHSMFPSFIAFVAEAGGVFVGIVLVYLFHIENKRVIGMLFGMTSGIMMGMICFDVLPEALESGRHVILLLGVGAGVLAGLLLDDLVEVYRKKTYQEVSRGSSIGIILIIGIALHNLPEGFALGAAGFGDVQRLNQFGWVIFLHSIPEAIAIALPMKYKGYKFSKLIKVALGLGGIMACGAFLGVMVTQMAKGLITLGLGVASGIILYIVCEELLPESKKEWNGRLTSVATVIGIIVGMYLVL